MFSEIAPTKNFFTVALFVIAALFVVALPANAWAAAILIDNSSTGGGCSTVGTWNQSSHTCTLTQDINAGAQDGIHITADGITLDGNGHTITGPGNTFVGVLIQTGAPFTVKNLKVTGFGYGMQAMSNHGKLIGNTVYANAIGIDIFAVNNNSSEIVGNKVHSNSSHGIVLSSSNSIIIRNNLIFSNGVDGIQLNNSSTNTIIGNSLYSNGIAGLSIEDAASGNTDVVLNNFSNTTDVVDNGTNSSFSGFQGGNYWSDYDTPTDGCNNVDSASSLFNIFCDDPWPITGGTGGKQDTSPFILPGGWSRFDFTWYDNIGGSNWVLMANTVDAHDDLWMDLNIAGVPRALPALPGLAAGQIPPGKSITPIYPDLMGGPVQVMSRDQAASPIVSQRILWPAGGNSLEEVILPMQRSRLSNTFWWPWYDMLSPGYKNWILISNPNAFDVQANIFIGSSATPAWSGVVPAGGQVNQTFPGVMGGPVTVQAFVDGTSNPANVMASQRVLTNNDNSFNEMPGIPDQDLDSHYFWTWYDMTGGAQNWILIANPLSNSGDIYYEIRIAGVSYTGGPIPPGGNLTPTFPGIMGGPVEVKTFTDPNNPAGTPAKSIATQRIVWGPSFGEVPGYPFQNLTTGHNWTWYDQQSAGAQNWVLIANPNTGPPAASCDIIIGGVPVAVNEFLYPQDIKTYTFEGIMNGPVQVDCDNNVIASQRVLWNGHFNEVWGQAGG